MPETALPVEFLFAMRATLATPMVTGTRVIVPVTGGTFEGPKLKGTVSGQAGGDWVTARPDGSLRLDVRITLVTDDGALIYTTYTGIGIVSGDGRALRTAPLFETADPRYAWLNNVLGVATGTSAENTVTYDVYALSF